MDGFQEAFRVPASQSLWGSAGGGDKQVIPDARYVVSVRQKRTAVYA